MKVKAGDKIIYKVNGVEKEGIVTKPSVLDIEFGIEFAKETIEVCSFVTNKTTYIVESDIVLIVRENKSTTLICETYEKPGEIFSRDYYRNGKKYEYKAPLRLFVRFYFDHEKKDFCMEINGAKNPYPFRKAYGINPNKIEKCLNEMGWTKINTQYWAK